MLQQIESPGYSPEGPEDSFISMNFPKGLLSSKMKGIVLLYIKYTNVQVYIHTDKYMLYGLI